jgi:monoamine oxidase
MNDGSSQVCSFDEGLYFNAGPARLPSHHQTMLGYCRELGVPLEVEVNMSRSALLQDDDANHGKPIEMRQAVQDLRGRVSELLAKCAGAGQLDAELSGIDHEKFTAFLKTYGDLDEHLKYLGSERAGYQSLPGAGAELGEHRAPLDLKTLLDPLFWQGPLFDEMIDMQATMFQPVGGMDRIPYAFYERLKSVVRLNTEVREIRNTDSGVSIACVDRRTGQAESVSGDFCICTIPPPVLKNIPSNFSPEFAKGIAEVVFGASNKIAWQAPRFWETDRQIYGGLSFINRDVFLIWYPSGGFFQPTGVLIGCYNFEDVARRFMAQPMAKRFQDSRDAIERLFPGRSGELEKGLTVAWNKVPYSLGPWTNWKEPGGALYRLLDQPEGRVYLAGEHMSHINGWQEGAAVSVHRVLKMIAERVAA